VRSMSLYIYTLPLHLDIDATVHVSPVSETRTQDIVGITNSGSGVKYVTVCVYMYTHIALACVHRCLCTCVSSVRDMNQGYCCFY